MTDIELTSHIHEEAYRIAFRMIFIRNILMNRIDTNDTSWKEISWKEISLEAGIKIVENEKLFTILDITLQEFEDAYSHWLDYQKTLIYLINNKIKKSEKIKRKLITYLTSKNFGI